MAIQLVLYQLRAQRNSGAEFFVAAIQASSFNNEAAFAGIGNVSPTTNS